MAKFKRSCQLDMAMGKLGGMGVSGTEQSYPLVTGVNKNHRMPER